ncbi:hypothetical protein QNM99_04310 [Pseudomonas sp. PCH446]
MFVDKLFIVAQGSPAADLAGAFLVSGPLGTRYSSVPRRSAWSASTPATRC